MQLYVNKIENLEEMDKFLEKYNLPRRNQDEIEKMNQPITSPEIKTVFKKLQTNKSPRPEGFTGEFYQKFREEVIPKLLKQFQKIAEEGTFPKSFSVDSITLIPKQHKDTTKKKKLQANFTDEHKRKNPQQNTSKHNPTIH